MGLLAYHPDHLRSLRASAQAALDELRAIRCDDPAAVDAMAAVRAANRDLDGELLPLVDRILLSPAMTAAERGRTYLGDLEQSLYRVMVNGYGWSLQRDTADDDPTQVTAEEARALGAMLNQVDLEELIDDPESLRWLGGQLRTIAADDGLTRELLANFHELARLCNALAGRRAALVDGLTIGSRSSVADLDAVLAGLAQVHRRALASAIDEHCIDLAFVLPGLDRMTPYAAALLVRDLGLDAATLARVAADLLRRWRHDRDTANSDYPTGGREPFADDWAANGPNAADLLFTALLARPGAAVAFGPMATAEPGLLFGTAADPALAHRVALAATDPAAVSAADAEGIVIAFIEHHRTHLADAGAEGYDADWPLFLVDLVAPWTLHFSPLDDDWRGDHRHDAGLLAFVLADDAAQMRLLADADRLTAGVAAGLADGTVDASSLEELAAYLGMLARLIVNGTVADAEHDRAAWDLMWGLVSLGSGIATGLAGVSTGGGLVIGAGLSAVEDAAERWAPDPERVAESAEYGREWSLTVAAAVVASSVHSAWVGGGMLPAAFPPPPAPRAGAEHPATDFVGAFRRWRDALPGGADGALADRVSRLVFAVVNPEEAGNDLAR